MVRSHTRCRNQDRDVIQRLDMQWTPTMPYLQLDLPGHYPPEMKRRLAHRISQIFAEIMQTVPSNVTVAFRELGDGNLWRCGGSEPVKAAVIACDVRRGRSPEQRARLAEALVSACVEAL